MPLFILTDLVSLVINDIIIFLKSTCLTYLIVRYLHPLLDVLFHYIIHPDLRMWFDHESTYQNVKTEINIFNLTKFLFKYVVDKESFIFYRHNVPLSSIKLLFVK